MKKEIYVEPKGYFTKEMRAVLDKADKASNKKPSKTSSSKTSKKK